jgi:putative membrane protein
MASDAPRPGRRPGVEDQPPAPEPGRPRRGTGDAETEPDARFTFANERTFLAWHRTALALIVAGLAIVQLLPPFPGVPLGRHLLAIPLILLGGVLSVASYVEWTRHQRALRRGDPMPTSVLPRVLAAAITALALAAVVFSLLGQG